jgi:CRISPR-associated protein (TIGR02584 family)
MEESRMEPADHPRRILLAVTGLSPQVVTETLYALAIRSEPAFVPSEIRLITTREGRERARLSLLHPGSGWFHRLRQDYSLPPIAFSDEHIQVLQDSDGNPLDDIRSPEDNLRAADAITEQVRRLTQDPDAALHVSIAGGRKTMGFYLGYALSLFGRPQDRLSHVLVSPPYESHPQFFYPTPYSEVIHTPPPDSRPLDIEEARVTLAQIPFVRLRDGLEQPLLHKGASYSQTVSEAQRAVPPLALQLDPTNRVLTAAGTELTLRPAEFALYWLMAERARASRPGVHWSEAQLGPELLHCYARLVGEHSGDYERAEQSYAKGVTKENLDPAKSHVNALLRRRLGRHAEPYLIKALETIPGSRYRRFGLDLAPRYIRIVDGERHRAGIPAPGPPPGYKPRTSGE